MADLLMEVESLRSAVNYAAAAVAAGSAEVPIVTSLVKAYASETYLHVAAESIQMHGGIGFTWEHDAHLYFKLGQVQRAVPRRRQLPPRVASEADRALRPPWDSITARSECRARRS